MHRLKELRTDQNLTQTSLGKLLNVQAAAISKYETNQVPLSDEMIKKICSIFNVSSDYLLGLTNHRSEPYKNTSIIREATQYGSSADLLQSIDDSIEKSKNMMQSLQKQFRNLDSALSGFRLQLEAIIIKLHELGVDETIISEATGISLQNIRIIIHRHEFTENELKEGL